MSPRFVKPQTVRIGDIIRVAWKTGNVERSITGKVGAREYEYSTRVLLSDDGQELMRYGGAVEETNVRVTMLERGEAGKALESLTLFDVEKAG